jgi:[protein-PII] uridylyltransferase
MHDRILFVIRNHLEMVRFANKFDLEDPESIDVFAKFVEGEQRLRFLYAHTYCDANATAPDLWNAHKEELHTQLYTNTIAVLEGKRAPTDPETIKNSYMDLEIKDVTKSELREHLDQVPMRYFSHSGREEVALHVSMLSQFLDKESKTEKAVINWRNDVRRTLTVIDIITRDQVGLFEKLTGAISISGLNILGARAVTRNDGIAIDAFYVEVEKSGFVEDEETKNSCEDSIRSFLHSKSSPDRKISELRKKIDGNRLFSNREKLGEKIPSQVDVYRDVNLGRTIVEVKAPDRVGLLHLLAKTISHCGFDIEFARIATEQGIATDIFHIASKDADGKTKPTQFLELREELSEALNNAQFFHEV